MHTYKYIHKYKHIYMYVYSAYAHPVASVKQMCTLMFTTPDLILVAFITGNSSLEPLIEGLYAQIHVNLR